MAATTISAPTAPRPVGSTTIGSIAEWLANGRQAPRYRPTTGLTLAELMKRYRVHVLKHYVKHGRPTSEQHDIAIALRPVRELYDETLVADFGPLSLKAVRRKMVEAGHLATSSTRACIASDACSVGALKTS